MVDVVEVTRTRAMARSGRAREIREAAGLSLAELSQALGVSKTLISRWERGECTPRAPVAAEYGRLLRRLARRRLA